MKEVVIGSIFGLIIFWICKKWEHNYYFDKELVGSIKYNDRNVFRIPLRKIYRPKKLSKDDYDVYLFRSVDRLKKQCNYVLVDMDDEDKKEIKEHFANNGK